MLYGIRRSAALMERMELVEDYPARVAAMLLNDEIDIGLVPVAIIPSLPHHQIVADYCIAAEGPVASVSLFSEVAINEVQQVLLDYQSRTSVNLARVLMREYWKVSPELLPAGEDYIADIKGTTAGVVIGDRALQLRQHAKYDYDLADAWVKMTGLPFVFAAWVSNKPIDEDFIRLFNAANAVGLSQLDAVIAEHPYPHYDLRTYYTRNISYHLDELKRKGLNLFLQKLQG